MNSNPILYTIKPGDTLYNLATKYGTTVQDIINTNLALDPYNLRVGPHKTIDFSFSIISSL